MTLVSTSNAFDVSSSNPGPGDKVTLTGTANPGQNVDFLTSFQMKLPVNSGKYEYEANGVEIPQKPNRFAVTATGVKDLNVGIKIGIWISKGFAATNGVATVSHSDVPPGRYDLKVFGEALDGGENVNLEVTAGTSVKADSAGKYTLSIDTSGVAAGDYKIEGAGETKVIQVGERKQTPVDVRTAPASAFTPATVREESGSNNKNSVEETSIKPVGKKTTENVTEGQNTSSSQPPAGQEKGFIGWLQDSLQGFLGSNKGG
jgi:hypothetical protein